MAKPLYQSGNFDPIGQIGEKILLLDESGPYGDNPWREIRWMEPVKGLGPHGVTLLWSQAAAVPAGYAAPGSGLQTGNIAAAGQTNPSQPSSLNMGRNQLLQFRWRPAMLALTGPVVHDIDILVNLPVAVARNGTNQVQGRWNMIDMVSSPADAVVEPAQGANKALPAAFGGPVEIWNNLSELFAFENTYVPAFTVVNNGSAAASAGAIGIRVYGFRFDLVPVTTFDSREWTNIRRLGVDNMYWPIDDFGKPAKAGVDFSVVPISGRGSASGPAS